MTRRDDALFTGAAVGCFLLAAFQVWYLALPVDRAALFDYCRWTEHLDCFESLQREGGALLPVLAALAGVLLFEASLSLLALAAEPPRSEAWAGLSRLASFPASGLAAYVLLSHSLDLGKTSPSAVLIALLSVGQNVLVVLRARLGVRMRDAGAVPYALAAAAALFGIFALQQVVLHTGALKKRSFKVLAEPAPGEPLEVGGGKGRTARELRGKL